MPHPHPPPPSAPLTAPSQGAGLSHSSPLPRKGEAESPLLAVKAALAKLARPTASPAWGVVPFKDERLDACFPAGGLQRGRWHEIAGVGAERELPAAAAGFAACLARKCADGAIGQGAIVWALQRDDLHVPGLPGFGVDPDRLIFVRADRDDEVLSVVEGALRTRGVAAVVGEISDMTLTAGKRLQLACEHGGAAAFLLRRRLYGVRKGQLREEGSAATTRWSIGPAPSGDDPKDSSWEPGLGPPRWSVRLTRCRGGRTGSFILEADDATGDVRVVAELADHAIETRERRQPAGSSGRARDHDDGRQRTASGGG